MPDFGGDPLRIIEWAKEQEKKRQEEEARKRLASRPVQGPQPRPADYKPPVVPGNLPSWRGDNNSAPTWKPEPPKPPVMSDRLRDYLAAQNKPVVPTSDRLRDLERERSQPSVPTADVLREPARPSPVNVTLPWRPQQVSEAMPRPSAMGLPQVGSSMPLAGTQTTPMQGVRPMPRPADDFTSQLDALRQQRPAQPTTPWRNDMPGTPGIIDTTQGAQFAARNLQRPGWLEDLYDVGRRAVDAGVQQAAPYFPKPWSQTQEEKNAGWDALPPEVQSLRTRPDQVPPDMMLAGNDVLGPAYMNAYMRAQEIEENKRRAQADITGGKTPSQFFGGVRDYGGALLDSIGASFDFGTYAVSNIGIGNPEWPMPNLPPAPNIPVGTMDAISRAAQLERSVPPDQRTPEQNEFLNSVSIEHFGRPYSELPGPDAKMPWVTVGDVWSSMFGGTGSQLGYMRDYIVAKATGQPLPEPPREGSRDALAGILVRQTINELPEGERLVAQVATLNTPSGYGSVGPTLRMIQDKGRAGELKAQARQLAASNDPDDKTAAKELFAYADGLEKMSYNEIVVTNQDLMRAFLFSVMVDPTNPVFDMIGATGRGAKLAESYADDVIRMADDAMAAVGIRTAGDAAATLDNVVREGQVVAGNLQAGVPLNKAGNYLLERTATTKAHFTVDAVQSLASQLLAGVTNPEDARVILNALVHSPGDLVTGVKGLSPEYLAAVGPGRWDPTIFFANPEVVNGIKLMQVDPNAVLKIDALKGTGGFNPAAAVTQLADNARVVIGQAFGTIKPESLSGGVRVGIKNVGAQQYILEYYDEAGNVTGTSVKKLTLDEARELQKKATEFLSDANAAEKIAKMADDVHKGILGDILFNYNPAFRVRNFLSAIAATAVDDTLDLAKGADQVANELASMTAGAPTIRMAEAVSGIADTGAAQFASGLSSAGKHWTEVIGLPAGNPLAVASKAAGKSLNEAKHVLGLPVTDSANAMRAFNYGYQRATTYIFEQEVPALVSSLANDIGLSPDDANRLANQLITAGRNNGPGGPSAMARTLSEFVTSGGNKIDLRSAGIRDEVLSASGWRVLESELNKAAASSPNPTAAGEAMANVVNRIIDNEKLTPAYILRSVTPEPGVFEWSQAAQVSKQADIADDIMQAALNAGVSPEAAQDVVRQVMVILDKSEEVAVRNFLATLAQGPADRAAMNVVFDMLADTYELRRIARSEVDDLSRQAVRTNTPAAWEKKWEGTVDIYKKLTLDIQDIIAARADDLKRLANGEQIPPRNDWWDAIRRFVEMDTAEVEQARALYAGSSKYTPADVFDRIIDANRQIVDASYVQLYDTFRRFPTPEGLDIIRAAQKNIDAEGAKAASFLAEQRELALNKQLPWDEYFAMRNATWNSVAENQVAFNEAASKAVVSVGLGKATPTGLKWTDNFAGGSFQLMGRKKNGNWSAMRLDDGTIHEFGVGKPDVERIMGIASEMATKNPKVRFGTGQSIDPKLLGDIRKYAENMTVGGDEFAGIVGDPTYLDAVKAGYTRASTHAVSALPQVPQAVIDDYNKVLAEVSKIDTDMNVIRQQMDQLRQTLGALATNGIDMKKVNAPSGSLDTWLKTDYKRKVNTVLNWLLRRSTETAPSTAPTPSNIAAYTIDNLEDARRQLLGMIPDWVAPKPGRVTQGQGQALQGALPQMQAVFDRARALGIEAGRNVANRAAPDYADRRGFDSMLSWFVTPYHYWMTRGGKNWAIRMASNPKLARNYARYQAAKQEENKRSDLPNRLKGTLPIPGTQLRIQDPASVLIPDWMVAGGYEYYEDDISDLERMYREFENASPIKPGPLQSSAINAVLNQVAPLPDGKQRRVGISVPQVTVAGDIMQATTGRRPGWTETGGNEYRIRRELAIMEAEGTQGVDHDTSRLAQQISLNLEMGRDRYFNIPDDKATRDAADKLYLDAAKRSGQNQLITSGGRQVTGVGIYNYEQGEKNIRQAQTEYFGAGYDPATSPFGSKADKREVLEKKPYLSTYWSRNSKSEDGKLEPAQSVRKDEMYRRLETEVYGPMTDAVTKALTENPDMKSSDLNAVKRPYWDLQREIKAEYADLPAAGNASTNGMNDYERALYELEGILRGVDGKPEYPGEDAAPEVLQKYYTDLGVWEEKRLDDIETKLNTVLGNVRSNTSTSDQVRSNVPGWKVMLAGLVEGEYASELVRKYDDLANAPDIEKEWSDRTAPIAEYKSAGFDEAATIFGQGAIDAYYSEDKPKYPDGGDKAAVDAYYKELDAWRKEHPEDAELGLWLNGIRPKGQAYDPSKPYMYDFGKDHAEAVRIFGPDIFDIEREKNAAPDWNAWKRANPEKAQLLYGYWNWQDAMRERPAKDVTIDTSTRPVGSNRQPIGGQRPNTQTTTVPATTGAVTESYNAPERTAAEWSAVGAPGGNPRIANVGRVFGPETNDVYQQYLNLPANSQARRDFKAANPELRAVQLYVWNPELYSQITKQFGMDAVAAWAFTPPYTEGDFFGQKVRSEFVDRNPGAWVVSAWLNGRPTGDFEQDGGEFTYNAGADFEQAKQMFGTDIFDSVTKYRGLGYQDKRDYGDRDRVMAFYDFWYANMPDDGVSNPYDVRPLESLPKSGRRYYSDAPGRSNAPGSGGYGGGGYSPNRYAPEYWYRYAKSYVTDPMEAWQYRSPDMNLSWMKAGTALRPDDLRAWKAPRY